MCGPFIDLMVRSAVERIRGEPVKGGYPRNDWVDLYKGQLIAATGEADMVAECAAILAYADAGPDLSPFRAIEADAAYMAGIYR
jgi:hypothetical protein